VENLNRHQKLGFCKNPKNFNLLFLILVFILSFILFGNSIGGKFVGDDRHIVQERTDLKSLKNIPGLFASPAYPGQPWIGIYRPLTLISYAFNFAVSDKPASFHVVNIILHALNVFLIFLITQRFASKKVAVISSLLFMFLPIHVEAVTSIVGRSEVLSIFFVLLSLFLFFKGKHIWASIAFLGALFSKDFSVFLLPLIGLLLLVETRSFWKSLKTGLYYLTPLPVYFALRYLALGKYILGGFRFNPVTAPLAFLGLKERIFTGFLSFFLYLRKTFYPVDLSPDYSFNQIPAVHNIFSSYQAVLGLILLLGFVAVLIFGRKNLKIAAAILLVPFFFISNMIFVTSGSFAERWWYFPSFGLLVILALGLDKLIEEYGKIKTPILVFLSVFLLWLSFLTIKQNRIWLNDRNFYVYAAKMSPNSAWTRSNLAAAYLNDGEYDKAKQEVQASLDIYGVYVPSLNMLGLLYWRDLDFKSAEGAFKKALQFDLPGGNTRGLYRNLAFLNFDFGHSRQALEYMKKTVDAPLVRGDTAAAEVDEMLYNIINANVGRELSSYSAKEKQKIGKLVRLVRGF